MIQLNKINVRHFFRKLQGTPIEYDLRNYQKILARINEYKLENVKCHTIQTMSASLIDRAQKETPLDELLIEAFALVREASRRVLGMRPFDVQILAGIVVHQGKLAEMQTGEGKTLVAVFPAYLNALTGKGVHILTFNDYLARRDAAWMGPVYQFLGLSVGYIQEGMSTRERKTPICLI